MAIGKPSTIRLLARSEVPAIYKEPFILSGYRRPECTYTDCLRYTLVLHNELGNFWTHFLPVWLWLFWILRLPPDIDLSDPYFYPLLSFWAGAIILHLFSSITHGFACKSSTVRDLTTMLDYLGISIYSYSGAVMSFYYQWPSSTYHTLFNYKTQLLCALVLICSNVTIFTCISLYYWPKYRYLVRALAVAVAYCTSIVPWLYRFRVCVMTEVECTPETFHLHFTNLAVTVAAAVFYTSKFPERLAPGKFDYFGQSHQLFHIAITMQTAVELHALPQVTLSRRAVLTQIPNFSPDFYTCILPHLLVVAIGIVTLVVFGVLVSRGQLVSHRNKLALSKTS